MKKLFLLITLSFFLVSCGSARKTTQPKKTNTKAFNFWAITPGLKYKIDDKWSIKGGVRFRDAFDSDKYRDYTKTYKAGIGYKLSKDTSVSIGLKRKVGDSEYNAIGLGYGVSF